MKKQNRLLLLSLLLLNTVIFYGCSKVSDNDEKSSQVPADKFDLRYWKINVPTDLDQDAKVDLITTREIQTYQHKDYFYLNENGHLVFAVPNKAFTTPNSSNTRSELHQVVAGLDDVGDKYANNFTLAANPEAHKYGAIGGRLSATLQVNHVATRAKYSQKAPAYSVVVGQIHATKDQEFVAQGKGFGLGNEPLKIYFKKWPQHQYGSVFWNYERNLEKDDPNRTDISYSVWGHSWLDDTPPRESGIALDETFSYTVEVIDNTMHLKFYSERLGSREFSINLANNVDANGKIDELDHLKGYAGDGMFFKAGAYDQCSTRDAPGFWYPACLGSGDWEVDKANGDYAQVTFLELSLGNSN